MSSPSSTPINVQANVVNHMTLCRKVGVPKAMWSVLDVIHANSRIVVDRMLRDRSKTSSKFYKEVPCVVAKSLSAKYQRNRKCVSVKKLVIPICADKGKIVQLRCGPGGYEIRIPVLSKKITIPVRFAQTPSAVKYVEFVYRRGWYCHVAYDVAAIDPGWNTKCVGVDRNCRDSMATVACPATGEVRHLGIKASTFNYNMRMRRKALQKQGKLRLLRRVSNKWSRRTKYENHVVSKEIVSFARANNATIAIEDLDGIGKGRASRVAKRTSWSYAQLLTFVRYKAALSGVRVIEVDPAHTSRTCSRCGLVEPIQRCGGSPGHSKSCSCGHVDHRDANAAFNIAMAGEADLFNVEICRKLRSNGRAAVLSETTAGPTGSPPSGKHFGVEGYGDAPKPHGV